MKIRLGVFAGALGALIAATAPSIAGPIDPAVSFTGYGFDGTTGTFSLGFEFATNSAITVNGLGIFDDGSNNGIVHAVGIYNSAGTLLTSTNITQGTGLVGLFDWASIAPITLAGGQDYYAVEETGAANYAAYPTGLVVSPDITLIQDEYVYSSTLAFPTETDGVNGIYGANFSVAPSAVPEPSSLAVLLTGLGLIGCAFNFCRKKIVASKV